MLTSIRQLILCDPPAPTGDQPVTTWDFDAGVLPAGFAVTRGAPALGYDAEGGFVPYPANTLRMDARGSLRTAILEPEATNLLPYAQASLSVGWTVNGASATGLALDALGLFSGVEVASGGALWHRLDQTFQPAVTLGETYHLSAFVRFGSSSKVLVTLRNMAAGVESRVECTESGFNVIGAGAGALAEVSTTALGVDGVHRIDLNFSPNYSGAVRIGLGPGSSVTGQTMVLLGAQFELGSERSSFIPSDGNAATRPGDAVTWGAPVGTYDLRIVDGAGAQSDHPAQTFDAGWSPANLPFFPARVFLYPTGTL